MEALRGTEGRKIPARSLDSAACNSVYTCFTVSVSPCAFHGASAMALLIAMVVAMFIVPLLRCCACIGVFLAKNPGGWVLGGGFGAVDCASPVPRSIRWALEQRGGCGVGPYVRVSNVSANHRRGTVARCVHDVAFMQAGGGCTCGVARA